MEFQSIITHMNEHHKSELISLLKKFGQIKDPKNIELKAVDIGGLDISYEDGKILRIDFPKKADNNKESITKAVIELCQSIEKTLDAPEVKKELEDFMNGFGSVVISSLSPDNEVICSYAPLLRYEDKYYIYISQVSEHYKSIKSNPKNLEIMFLEDESSAKSVILRKRVRFRAEASFIERNDEFDKVFDTFEKTTEGMGGIKTIRNMEDFHLVKLEFGKGRFVKGFGQAYDIKNGEISYIGGAGNPHKFKK